MRILDRYVLREFLKILLGAVIVFAAIYVIVDLFEKLSKFLEARVPFPAVARYYLLSLPGILFQVLPVATLMAGLLSLGTMARRNEILAMQMSHLGTLRIAVPLLCLGAVLSGAAFGAGEFLLPHWNQRALNIWRTRVRRLPAHRLTKNNDIWYRAAGNRFLHISLMDAPSGRIHGISLFHLSPDFRLIQRLDAREAQWNGQHWILRKGYAWTIEGADVEIKPFETMPIPLAERPGELGLVVRAPEEMSFTELQAYIDRLVRSGIDPRRYQVDLHAKVALAWAAFIMALLGITFGLRVGKAGVMAWVGLCIPLGFLYWVLLSLGFSLGRGGALPPVVAAWLPNALFGVGGIVSLVRIRR